MIVNDIEIEDASVDELNALNQSMTDSRLTIRDAQRHIARELDFRAQVAALIKVGGDPSQITRLET